MLFIDGRNLGTLIARSRTQRELSADEVGRVADEIIFCQRVRNQLLKALPGRKKKSQIEQAVRDLVDDAVESEGVVDIFAAADLPRADISVLDESFLQSFKDKPHQNLRLMLLEQLLSDEIRRRQPHAGDDWSISGRL